ncbi:DNA adenine methylase [Escherichia coli]
MTLLRCVLMSTYRPHASCLFPKQIAPRFTISSAKSSTKARICSVGRCFSYLNRYGYNGLCRYNLRGEFNVPFGRYKKPYFPEAELYHFAEKRRMPFSIVSLTLIAWRAQMMHLSSIAIRLMHRCLRPPTLRRITQTVLRLNNKRIWRRSPKVSVNRHIPVLISNHDTMLTREWYQRAKLHVVKVRRSISSNGGTRKKVDELLALYKPGVVSPAKK